MLVGTPLYEEEESVRGPKSFVPTKKVDPLWKQEVVDAEGRRRFHGAFTGGYSAGYFNTVGSAEGWAPKTFKSSRSNRNNQQQQTAEDFMDEDDLTSFGGKQLQTNSQYDSLGSTATDIQRQTKHAAEASRSVIPGDAPLEFVAPANEGIGKQLLRLMGWREGQGVGPRRARKRKRLDKSGRTAGRSAQQPSSETALKRYSCPPPPDHRGSGANEGQDEDEDADEEDDPYGAAFLFAPKNTSAFDPGTGKDNFFGLGFDPFTGAPEFRKQQQDQHQTASRISLGSSQRKRGAFGIGALEDEDDHEVYDHTERCEYDFETGGAEGESTRGKGHHPSSAGPITSQLTSSSIQNAPGGGVDAGGRCSDGMPALVGFVVATRSSLPDKWYASPTVPRDFRPFHIFKPEEGETGATAVTSGNWVVDESTGGWRLEKTKPIEPKNGNQRVGSNLSASQRGHALGEPEMPSRPPPGVSAVSVAPPPPRLGTGSSLMSMNNPGMSESDRQKIAATLAAGSRFVKASDSDPGTGAGQTEPNVPAVLAECFLPDEPSKQARLEAYYKEQKKAGCRKMDTVASEEGPWAGAGMTEWEVSREKEEFNMLIHGGAAESGGLQSGAQVAAAAKAAKAVFRSTTSWAPMKLLCKRFNVPDPHGGNGRAQNQRGDSDQTQTRELLSLPDEVYRLAHKQESNSTSSNQHSNEDEAKQSAEVGAYSAAAEDVAEKPVPNGIFKAIFEESSSDDDDDDEEDEEEHKEKGDVQVETLVGASRNAMVAIEQDPLQSLFRESGRYDPLPGQPARDEGDTQPQQGTGRSSRVSAAPTSEPAAVVVPQGSLKRGVYQQGGWLSRDPIPSSGGRGTARASCSESGMRLTPSAGAQGPMGRGMGTTQPAWMAAKKHTLQSGWDRAAVGRAMGPDAGIVDQGEAVGSAVRPEPRSFNVQLPVQSARVDAREQELRQAMIASAANRQRASAEQIQLSSDLQRGATRDSTSSSSSNEDKGEDERRARKKSKHSHKKEKKSKHKKKKRKHKKEKSKKSRSSVY